MISFTILIVYAHNERYAHLGRNHRSRYVRWGYRYRPPCESKRWLHGYISTCAYIYDPLITSNTYWQSSKKACPFHLGFGQSNDPSRSSQTILSVDTIFWVIIPLETHLSFPCMKYIPGIRMPWLMVIGITGLEQRHVLCACERAWNHGYQWYMLYTYALGKIHLTWGNMFDNSSARKDQPAPESPRPWNQKTVAVCLALAPTMTDVREVAILTESVESKSRWTCEPRRETTTIKRVTTISNEVCNGIGQCCLTWSLFCMCSSGTKLFKGNSGIKAWWTHFTSSWLSRPVVFFLDRVTGYKLDVFAIMGAVDGEARDLLETSWNDFIQEPRMNTHNTALCNCMHPPLEKEPSNSCYYRLFFFLSPYINQHDIALHTRDDKLLCSTHFKDLGRVLHLGYSNQI